MVGPVRSEHNSQTLPFLNLSHIRAWGQTVRGQPTNTSLDQGCGNQGRVDACQLVSIF